MVEEKCIMKIYKIALKKAPPYFIQSSLLTINKEKCRAPHNK
jgi:hypothetical protein